MSRIRRVSAVLLVVGCFAWAGPPALSRDTSAARARRQRRRPHPPRVGRVHGRGHQPGGRGARRAARLRARDAGRPRRLHADDRHADARGEDAGGGVRRALGRPRGVGGLPDHPRGRRRGDGAGHAHRCRAPRVGPGREDGRDDAKKAASDVAAYARTLATGRGRNVEWAEQAVNESRAFTETEALNATPPLIDLVATDVPDLLKRLDGRVIKRFDGHDGDAAGRRTPGSNPSTMGVPPARARARWRIPTSPTSC